MNQVEADEGTPLIHSPKTDLIDIYQSLIRFMAREDALKKLLIYIVSRPFDHGEDAGNFQKLINHLHFLGRTAGLLQSSDISLERIKASRSFSKDIGMITEKIWPLIFSGLVLHDGIVYFTEPHNCYGNTLLDILGGISPNQLSLGSHLGGDRPDTVPFWMPLALPLVLFIGLQLTRLIQTYLKNISMKNENDLLFNNVNGDEDPFVKDLKYDLQKDLMLVLWNKNISSAERLEALERIQTLIEKGGWLERFYALQGLSEIADSFDEFSLGLAGIHQENEIEAYQQIKKQALESLIIEAQKSNFKNLLQYIYSNYLLWSLGKSKKIPAHILFFPLPIYILYAKVRLLEIFVQKIIEVVEYFEHKKACAEQNKQWVYMPNFGNYECTVCGEWPFVYYNNVFDSEGCLTGLLSKTRTPEEIFNYLGQILKHPDFKTLDMSRQNWTLWAVPQWEMFLGNFSAVTDSLTTFNLSQTVINPIFPEDGLIKALSEFLSQVSVESLDLSNQGIGDRLFSELVQAFDHNTLSYLDISSNQLSDESAARLSQFIQSSKTLQILKAAHNPLSDMGISHIAQKIPNSNLTVVDVSDTDFGEEGTQALASAISDKNSEVQVLDISNNDLSLADAGSLGQAVADSTLEALDISNTNFNDFQASQFMPFIAENKNSTIKSIDFSGNPLTDQGMFLIVNDVQNSTITALYFNHNFVTDEGLEAISSVLNNTMLENLSFANAKSFSVTGVKKVLTHLPATAIQLDISENDLGDNIADVFVDAFNNDNNSSDTTACPLKKIYLGGNLLTDDGGEKLVKIFALHNVTDVRLNHNNLTDQTIQILAEVFPEAKFISLDFSDNVIGDDTGTVKLASHLPGSNLEQLSLADNQLTDMSALAIAENLLTPTPNIKEIGEENPSIDEARLLRKAKPQTNLTLINMENNLIGNTGVRAFCAVLPNTDIEIQNLKLDSDNCQTSSATKLRPFAFSFSFGFFSQREQREQREIAVNYYPALSNTNTNFNANFNTNRNINSSDNNSNNSHAAAFLGAAFMPGVTTIILGLLAFYLLYKAFSPIGTSIWERGASLFAGVSKNPANPANPEILEKSIETEKDSANTVKHLN